MTQGRLVPWQSWNQWASVKAKLQSEDAIQVAEAIGQVNAWRARGRLPLSIDIYVSLKDIQPRLEILSRMPNSMTEYQVRLESAMSIIRLVNGITDSGQKGKVASSVASIANDTGLPRILVDIRHEASHNDLPSLPILKLGVSLAIEWLNEHYWARQEQQLFTSFERIVSLLQELVKVREMAVRKSFQRPDAFLDKEMSDHEENLSDKEESDDNDEDDVTQNQKRKRGILGELKELIHPAQSHLVADAILDFEILPRPEEDDNREDTDNSDLKSALRESVLSMLIPWLPDLPSTILKGAIDRILDRHEPTLYHLIQDNRQSHSLAWARFWIQSSVTQESIGEGICQWMPNTAQFQAFYKDCIITEETQSSRQLSTILNNTLTQNLGKCSTEEKLNTLNEESLQLSSKQIEKKQKIEYKAQDTKNDLEGLARAEMDNQLKDLENLMSMKQNQAVTNEKKWHKADDWNPCGLGNLPDLHSINGRPSIFHGQFLRQI